MNKKKVKEGMLRWQNTLINRSLLDIADPMLNKLALQVSRRHGQADADTYDPQSASRNWSTELADISFIAVQ